jgi:hypothetical protein
MVGNIADIVKTEISLHRRTSHVIAADQDFNIYPAQDGSVEPMGKVPSPPKVWPWL